MKRDNLGNMRLGSRRVLKSLDREGTRKYVYK